MSASRMWQPTAAFEFDFAIGFPDLSVELVMPKAAFDEFCRRNDVELIGPGANPPLTGEGD